MYDTLFREICHFHSESFWNSFYIQNELIECQENIITLNNKVNNLIENTSNINNRLLSLESTKTERLADSKPKDCGKRKNAKAFFYLFKYITKTKQPLDLYIPTVSDIISIGGPEGTREELLY